MQNLIQEEILKTKNLLTAILQNKPVLESVEKIALICVNALRNGGKIMFAGNGGSAADSQHLAAELVSRLRFNRPGLPGLALTTDTSAITAIGNDYSFEAIFSRQVEAVGRKGDVLIGISTSGKSPNVLRAFETAREMEIVTVGFTRDVAPMMTERCDYVLNIPSHETAKVQECHILFGHIVCRIIEDTLFGAQYDPMLKEEKMAVMA
jgi:D-sedoheptulose 7-phosphate isomerase